MSSDEPADPAWETEKALRQILGRVYRLADGWYAEVLRIEASQGHSPYSAALAKCSGELLRTLGFENVDEAEESEP